MIKLEESNPKLHYVFHNISFDYGVMDKHDVLSRALEEGRAHDTYVIDSMRCALDDGYIRKDRKLAQIYKRRFNKELEKPSDVRLTFNRGMNRDVPEAHIQYAMKDAKATYDLAELMDWRAFPTEPLKVRMMIALDDISRRGFLTDEPVRIALKDKFQKELDETTEALADWGWYAKEKGCEGVLQHILEGVEKDLGIRFARTEKSGKIKTTDESLEPIEGDEFIDCYKARAHANKMIKTYLGDKNIGNDKRVHTRFNLAVTMRTTSSKPNIQNIPRKGGIRGMFIPPPGYLLCATDYAQLELCALAESCYRRFGHSKLMETINAGVDCHKYMGTFLTGKPIEHITKDIRQLSKVCNFGYPGGLQPSSFVAYAAGYGLKITEEKAEEARQAWLMAFPEMEEHLQGTPDITHPGMYRTKTWTGFERANCISTEIANTEFQSPSGDGASEMLWAAYCAKLRTVNFIHDELINEIKLGSKEQVMKEVKQIADIMIGSMKKVVTHVNIKVESSLMTRWFKEAEEELDETGALLVMTGNDDQGKPVYEPIENLIN
jgi:DNA polymerase I-like protein with 3'-5' exonuclease and polymerase domains